MCISDALEALKDLGELEQKILGEFPKLGPVIIKEAEEISKGSLMDLGEAMCLVRDKWLASRNQEQRNINKIR